MEKMEDPMPWDKLLGAIKPYYPQAGKGREPYPLESIVRVHCVQLFYNLSGPAMEDMLYEIESVRHLTGIRRTKVPERLPSPTPLTCWNVTDWAGCCSRPSRSTWQSKD